MPDIPAVAIIAVVLLLILGVVLIIAWFRHRREIQPYTRLGLYAAAVLTIAYLVGAAGMWFAAGETHVVWLAFELTFNFFWTIVVVATGTMLALAAAIKPFPLIRPLLGDPRPVRDISLPSLPEPVSGLRAIAAPVVLLVAAALGYTALILYTIDWEPGVAKLTMAGIDMESLNPWNPFVMLSLTCVSIVEELTFRLAIQNQLARMFKWRNGKYWLAIIATALLWTFVHAGAINPDWVKFLQVFPLGLALGWMARKYGIESCLAAHVLLNLTVIFLPM